MEDERARELMLRSGREDLGAFAELVEEFRGPVLGLVHRYVGRHAAEAEDLTQEVFIRAWGARQRYRPEAKFKTWLFRIATNRCLNHLRDRKGRRAISLSAGDPDRGDMEVIDPSSRPADEGLASRELQKAVQAAIERLPEAQRLAILHARYDDLSHAEIAEILGLTEKSVKSLLFRARENLRRFLEPQLGKHIETGGSKAKPGREEG